ncbi:aspartate kinase [Alistipes sp.]|uniref:aspartate kinase n=1 Tax=Alistipes sp. TaxID=1872444 RepID=UPI0025C13F3E|nr:aspartate kinase [Alistipes sp.]MCI7141335.1 aspartate kinase [Alistipes sp.]MDY5397238.1 aspartate kinase [Alistipes sp.]
MKVYKFGGASVRNADGVRNLRKIIDEEQHLFIIVSAMGKTTNALERVFAAVQRQAPEEARAEIAALREYHAAIIDDLWRGPKRLDAVERLFGELEQVAEGKGYAACDAELWYDRIVAYGELVSTTIISEYLNYAGVPNRWIDMRRCFLTEQRHKDAGVDIEASAPRLKEALAGCPETIFVGQGFIGGAPDGTTTTLGREGSDYSAAVVANILDAESMSVWKDVDGILNADPKIFPDAVQIAELNYLDTIELAYSGAQIIHPKTIKPLQNKNIPLYVRPFGDKRKPGTVIRGMSAPVDVPILILKKDQVLLTIRSRDFSFVLEEKFATIFSLLERFRVKTNLIHNSAVNLSLCVDNSWHIDEAVNTLRANGFDVMKTGDMELLTIRGYTDELWRRYAKGPQVFIRQATQATVRVVRKR